MSDHIPTFADVCCAIAEGHITAVTDGSVYQVNVLELRRYFNRSHPTITIGGTQESASTAGSCSWSGSIHPSVA